MTTSRFDSVCRMNISGDTRQDAVETAFFSRDLTHIRAQAYEVQYPELKGRLVVPKNPEPIHPGAETYIYQSYARTGKATWHKGYAKDGPRADVAGSETTQKIRSMSDSYGYNIQEARAAQMARLPLNAMKAKAARLVIETLIDTTIFDGKSDLGLAGFLAISGVGTYTTPVGDGGLKTFESKTPDEIMLDLNGIAHQIVSDTNEVEKPDTLLLPSTSYDYIATTRMGDGDPTSILKHFLGMQEYIKTVIKSIKCEAAGTAASKRMVAYKRSADKVNVIIPQEFEQLMPERRGFEVVTQCHARMGGVIAPFPKSIMYGDYI